MLVRDLQQVLGQFTDKFNKGMGKVEGKGNAIMYAKVYVDLGNGRLSEIQKIEAHENTLIGATEGVRVVLKTLPPSKSKIILQKGVDMFELTEEQRKQLLQYLWTRPYGEVASIIGMLASLKSKKNDDVTPKN